MVAKRGQNGLTSRAIRADSISGASEDSTNSSHCGSQDAAPSSSFFSAIGVAGAGFISGFVCSCVGAVCCWVGCFAQPGSPRPIENSNIVVRAFVIPSPDSPAEMQVYRLGYMTLPETERRRHGIQRSN